ncbi:hypothetical protein BCR35DRAFT_282805 [Leucosporidium creatinivorum]|uniref:Cation efflux protein transmembrane domain-containing protein n=1 Tax=Leucosporidium creatinivorum TaxID=106004 RepID=A0A1Y2E5X9_9BASI|nr:hypothetical protein BCR35DRAFT_282805 [Leucosporidium creatinivorum]
MVPRRPAFTVYDSAGRSSSRERDLEAGPRERSDSVPRRRLSDSHPTGVIVEGQVYEGESAGEQSESEPLLSSLSRNPSRRPHRLSNGSYGATSLDSPVKANHLALHGVPPMEGGETIHRQESVLKLAGLIDDRGGEFEKFRKSDEELKKMKKSVRAFYIEQNEILDGFAEVDEILDNTGVTTKTGDLAPMVPTKPSAEREEAFNLKVQFAINVNFLVNFILLGAKIAVVLLSNSMSLVASTVDSAMDFLSTVIIYGTSRVIATKNWKSTYHYPTGKKRMEPMGVVVFSVFMISSFLQVAIESLQRIFSKELEPAEIPLVGLIVMGSTIAIKLVMWVWCRTIKNTSVEALTQDAENDIVFNFFSILFPYAGQLLGWPLLDPIGGLVLSIYIIVEWVSTLRENILKLTGRRATPHQHQRIAYLLTRFSPLIIGVQHLSVYHAGESFVVETDIVLPPNTALTVAHNLGESVQYAIEQLEGIDRAFVHNDVSVNPLSGHLDR